MPAPKTQSYHFRLFIDREQVGNYRIIKPSLPAAVSAFRKWFSDFHQAGITYRITASTTQTPDVWEWVSLDTDNRF